MSNSQKNNFKNLDKAIKIIRHPIFISHHNQNKKNKSIKTSEFSKTVDEEMQKPAILKFINNNEISKAIQTKNGFNQTNTSIFIEHNKINNNINRILPNLKPISSIYTNNTDNKESHKFISFNNSFLNKNYNSIKSNSMNLTKVKNQYLRLKNIYNPHINYSEIVKERKDIIQVFLSQTKNNFNNNYYLIYSNPNKFKRNYISKVFTSIKKNKKKNIDKGNSIKKLAEKEIYNKTIDKLFNEDKKTQTNINNNISISIPSSFELNNFVNKTGKFKIKTLNVADDIVREYSDPIIVKKKKRVFDIIQIGNRKDMPSTLFDIFIVVVILVNLFITIFDTFDESAPYSDVLDKVELVTIIIFTVEYILRIWTAEFLYPKKEF